MPIYRFNSDAPLEQLSCTCLREFRDDQEAIAWGEHHCWCGPAQGDGSVWQGERLVFTFMPNARPVL